MSSIYEVKLVTKTKEYPIYVGRGIINYLPKLLDSFKNSGKCAVITNKIVGELYGKFIEDLLSVKYDVRLIVVPNGEECKDLRVVERVYEELITSGFDRYSTIVALGGGSVGDLSGFVAATYMRGINYVQVPTTLLAQVDAAVGGKAAINISKGKNIVGVFYHPHFVLVDVNFLRTHELRDFKSGLAEVVKYGVVLSREFYEFVKVNWRKLLDVGSDELLYAVRKSCEFKASVVSLDEFDREGIRALLNYGHTVGHALEAYSNYELRHGEAVAIGMCYEAKISVAMGYTKESTATEVCSTLESLGLPTKVWGGVNVDEVLSLMRRDKKVFSGKIAMVLLRDIGSGVLVRNVPEEVIKEVITSW
jgi:3-dehydroquinate synthase